MRFKQAAALAALMAVSAPGWAFDPAGHAPSTIFYLSIPLDSRPSKMAFGLRLQGNREYQVIDIDSRILRFVSLGGIEAKWLVAGAVAIGAAAAIGGDRRAEEQAAASRQQAAASRQAQPCPQACK
jgi:hypothetical protein